MSEPETQEPPKRTESQEGFEANVAMERQWSEAGHKLAQCNRNEKIIEEKEQQIRSVIQANYARIKDAEKELQDLQLQLKSTVGPKRSVLELLRKKIEAQNIRVVAQRAKVSSAKAVLTREEEALKVEEDAKDRLCHELNLVVQESATAEMDRLNQLSSRLTQLTAGVAPEAPVDRTEATKAPSRDQDGASSNPFLENSAAPATARAEAAADPNNPFEDAQSASDEPSADTLEAERQEEERKQQQQQMASAAKAARQKHVMLKKQAKQQPSRPKQDPASQPPSLSSQQPSAPPSQQQSQSSPFSGFDT